MLTFPQYTKVEAILGAGAIWGKVLDAIPEVRHALVHPTGMNVGVAGFLVGGGVDLLSGVSKRFGSGPQNVLGFTMVNAMGDILVVSESDVRIKREGSDEVRH